MVRDLSHWPELSVIVPVAEDPDGLVATLDSLLETAYPTHRYEIVVVADSAADATLDVLDAYATEYDQIEPAIEAEYHTPGAARNVGIRISDGEVLFFIDANMTLLEGDLVDLVTTFERTSAPYMGCGIEIDTSGTRRSVLAEYDRTHFLQVRESLEKKGFAPSSALVTTRDLFEDVEYFEPELVSHEDYRFGRQVVRAGHGQAFDADVASQLPECRPVTLFHPARETSTEHYERAFKMGRGKCQLAIEYGESGEPTDIIHWRLEDAFQAPTTFHDRYDGWDSLAPGQQLWMIFFQRAHRLAWVLGAIYEYVSSLPAETHGWAWTRKWEVSSRHPDDSDV